MARIRSVKPEFFTDAAIGECSTSARLAFIATWIFADDYGNLERSAKQLKAQAFPYDTFDVEPLLRELLEHGCLVEYEAGGKKYLHIKAFEKHQRVDRKSPPKHPPFPASPSPQRELVERSMLKGREGSGVDQGREEAVAQGQNGKAVAYIPLNDGSEFGITEAMVAEFEKLYPAVDVRQTLNEIRGWNLTNAQNRKTRSGVLRHVNRWLAKEQDKAGRIAH